MIQVPAAFIEFAEHGNTIWVGNNLGATILRIQTKGKITANGGCENICSHSDMVVPNDIEICLSKDAKPVTDLERMKDTFDKTGVFYLEKTEGDYTYLYMASEKERDQGFLDTKFGLSREIFFEFNDEGKLASHP